MGGADGASGRTSTVGPPPQCEIDLRPGGQFRYTFRAPDGQEHGVMSTYREVVVPERLVLVTGFTDLPGVVIEQTVTFAEHRADKTEVMFAMVFPDPATLTDEQSAILKPRALGARRGSTMTLGQLAEVLARRVPDNE